MDDGQCLSMTCNNIGTLGGLHHQHMSSRQLIYVARNFCTMQLGNLTNVALCQISIVYSSMREDQVGLVCQQCFYAFHKFCFEYKSRGTQMVGSIHQKHAIKFKNLDCLLHVSYTLLWFTNKTHRWWIVSIKNNSEYWFGINALRL